MKRWIALALGLAAIAFGLTVLLSRAPSGQGGSGVETVWPSLTADLVREIEIRVPAGRYVLGREDKVWVVRPGDTGLPAKAKADPVKMGALLDLLAQNKPIRALSPSERQTDAVYGLDQPRVRIAVSLDPAKGQTEGLRAEVILGRATPSGDGLYAINSLSPGTVFLLGAAWERQANHPAEHYLDTRVLAAAPDKVTRLRSMGPGGPIWDISSKDGSFFFVLPEAAKDKPVAESEVKLLIHNLSVLKTRLLPDGTQAAGAPWLRYEIWSGGAAPEVVEIFGDEPLPGTVLARSSWQPGLVALERGSLDKVVKSGFDLEGRKVLNLDTGKVQVFRIVSGGQSLSVDKAQEGWVDSATGKALRGIDLALWRLTDVKFEADAVPSLPATAEEEMTCEALDKSGASLVVLHFYTDTALRAELCWLRLEGDPSCYPVSGQLLKDLQGLFPLKK